MAEYCEHAWSAKVGILKQQAPRAYAYIPRRTAQEVEEHRPHRALQGNLQAGLAPSSEQVVPAKGGGSSSSFGADFFPVIGDGKLPQRPYIGTRRHTTSHRAPEPVPLSGQTQCTAHSASACMTCKRLRRTAEECCKLGHHADEQVARRPQLQLWGSLKRSARALQLFGCPAVLETHTLRY